ncbi:MAG: hypothetical protein PHS99_03225 [Candidatus Marinimicrobia bacterium]|nr:hypothetical protein [Candidatus Neomarinimicrobiota bacterium]
MFRADWYLPVDSATIGYQRLHATQLNVLYRLTWKEIFRHIMIVLENKTT